MNCALITGGSKGIGRAIAIQLAIEDPALYILINYASDDLAAKETLELIKKNGGNGELLKFRVQDKTAVDKTITEWQKLNPDKFISILINNAGVAKDSFFIWMNEENWDDVISVSLKGMYNVSQNVIQQMLHHKKGRIINISSISGMKGVVGQTNYSAAKAGLIGATKALAQEVAKMKITVNAVAPGFINTAMTKNLNMGNYLKLIPVGRMGEPEEVAHVVCFLASDKASYITGEVINVNGGIYS